MQYYILDFSSCVFQGKSLYNSASLHGFSLSFFWRARLIHFHHPSFLLYKREKNKRVFPLPYKLIKRRTLTSSLYKFITIIN